MNIRDNQLTAPAPANSTDPGATSTRAEGLLSAVVAACECMVQQTDLLAGLQAAVQQLGRLSGHDRAYVWELTEEQTVCVCIAEWNAPGIGRISDMAGMTRFAVADFMEVWAPLLAGQAYQSITPLKTGTNAVLSQAVANRSDVMVPIFVGDCCWGCIGFDNCTEERRYGPAEIQALRGAAAAVAAAVQRSETESSRLAEQRHTAEEALALNSLLEGVVLASRALLDERDFNQGLQRWLAYLARAVEADAAMLGSLDTPAPAGALTTFSSYWARDGSPQSGQPIPVTTDFVLWTARLQRGDWIWAHRDELQDPASVAFWEATDCTTNLLMPVVSDGRTVGWLGFDWRERRSWQPAYATALRTAADGVAAALQRQNAVQQMLAERESRIAIERRRADEASVLVARIERHAHLLEAVARSAEILLAAPAPNQGIDRVLEILCMATGADRVCHAHFEFTPTDAGLHGWRHITNEWNRPGTARKLDTELRSVPMHRTDGAWEDNFAKLKTTGWFRKRVEEFGDSHASALRQMGVVWVLRFAVLAGERVVALLGFDYSDPFEEFEEATIDALQTVASAIADALLREELETRALAAERARADESAHLAALLAHVVNSSRTLINAELQAFEPALLAWLGGFGSAVGAIRCTFYDLVDFESTGLRTARMLAEWVREGVGGSIPVSFAAPITIDPRGAESLMAQLTSGQAIAFHTDDTVSPMREFLVQQGNATVVAVPLVMDGKPWGCLSFDHAERREPQSGEFAVLQTAADTLAAILKRNEAKRRMLDEREARLTAEQRRRRNRLPEPVAVAAAAGARRPGGLSLPHRRIGHAAAFGGPSCTGQLQCRGGGRRPRHVHPRLRDGAGAVG
jgi:transcriptional regulator with GAF, ATPase, and Fis domain